MGWMTYTMIGKKWETSAQPPLCVDIAADEPAEEDGEEGDE